MWIAQVRKGDLIASPLCLSPYGLAFAVLSSRNVVPASSACVWQGVIMGCPVLQNERDSEPSRQIQIKKARAGPESQYSFTECHLSAFSLLFRYDTAVKSKNA